MAQLPRLIVLTSTFPRWTGDQQPDFVLALCRRLLGSFRITVVAPHALGAADREQIAGVDVVRFRYAPAAFERLAYRSGMVANLRVAPWLLVLLPVFLWAQARMLRRLTIGDDGPLVVHAHWLFPQGWVAAQVLRRLNVPLLVTAHGTDVMKLRGWFWDWGHRRSLSVAKAITGVGPEVAERLNALGASAAMLPLGVDTDFFFDTGEARLEGGVLFVGRLASEKGVQHLIEAVALRAKQGGNVRLLIAGEGAERSRLTTMAAALGMSDRVQFLGWQTREQLRELYRKAACCVFPSLREGFGLALVEALACGAPVLASDLPTFRAIDSNLHVIKFFPVGDSAALARLLANALDASRETYRLSAEARELAMTYSATVAASAYAEILTRLVRGAEV